MAEGCVYNNFDARTLEPLNDRTRLRIKESYITQYDFSGKSVLDIGCNLGFFSLLTVKQGARKVVGIDITKDFVETSVANSQIFLGGLSPEERAKCDLRFEVRAFKDLDESYRSDVVLCYEVVHWLTAQGIPISESIKRLASLAKSDLLFETPWDISEPSIAAQTKMTKDEYDAEIIMRELTNNFKYVYFIGFVTYMLDPRTKRFLVLASHNPVSSAVCPTPKTAPAPVDENVAQSGIGPIKGFLLSSAGIQIDEELTPPGWGRRTTRLLKGKDGLYFFKSIDSASRLLALPARLRNETFRLLAGEVKTLIVPIPVNGEYIFDFEGKKCSIAPSVKDLDFDKRTFIMDIAEQLDILTSLNAELAGLPASLIADIRKIGALKSYDEKALHAYLARLHYLIGEDVAAFYRKALDPAKARPEEDLYTRLIYGDFNLSNVVKISDGNYRLVDLDNIQLGNEYTDFVYMLAINGQSEDSVSMLADRYKGRMGDRAGRFDCDSAIHGLFFVLGWMNEFLKRAYSAAGVESEFLSRPVDPARLEAIMEALSLKEPILSKGIRRDIPKVLRGLRGVTAYLMREERGWAGGDIDQTLSDVKLALLNTQGTGARTFADAGAMYYGLKKVEEARELLEASIRLDPENAITMMSLGVVYISLDRMDEARAVFKKILELDPKNTSAAHYLETVTGLIRMRDDWDSRAIEDARYFSHVAKRDQTDQEFDSSGLEHVKALIAMDLVKLTGNRDPKSMKALEIGCGAGRMTKHMAGIFGEAWGVDVSGQMIERARQWLFETPNAHVFKVRGNDLSPFDDAMFDYVFSYATFQHIPYKEVILSYITEAHRVMKPGAVFKFQVQGYEGKDWLASPKNTLQGVTVTEREIAGLCEGLGFEVIAKTGQGTQYSWYALKKMGAASTGDSTAGAGQGNTVMNELDMLSRRINETLKDMEKGRK